MGERSRTEVHSGPARKPPACPQPTLAVHSELIRPGASAASSAIVSVSTARAEDLAASQEPAAFCRQPKAWSDPGIRPGLSHRKSRPTCPGMHPGGTKRLTSCNGGVTVGRSPGSRSRSRRNRARRKRVEAQRAAYASQVASEAAQVAAATRDAARSRRAADEAYRRALGLEPDEPLPAVLGTANGGRGGRRRTRSQVVL